MFNYEAKEIRRLLLARCVSVVLAIAVCFVNVPFSFAEFGVDGQATFSASVTISGATADADSDGIDDSWELSNGLDPSDPDDAYLDNDNDGINNLEEYRLGTNPNTSNSGIAATLSSNPSSGLQPLNVIFTSGYSNNTYPIVKYEWDFDGNGTYDMWSYASEGNQAAYKFTAAGTYNVKTRVIDSMGNAGVAATTVTVTRNQALAPPVVSPELSLVDIPIPTAQELYATAYAQNSKRIARYQWDTKGNGEYDISSNESPNIIKTYNETTSRSFNASIKVTDTEGLSDIGSVGINTDASAWDSSENNPKVYLNSKVVYATAGVPVSLGGYGAPIVGYAKKLEWDFESDGVCDWSSELTNPGWTGRADVTHIYSSPGIYRARLTVNTEATLAASDTVLVIVSAASGLIPQASALVSYNGTQNAASINGIVPVKARFDHSASTGAVKYEWDFDGDKRIDYTTSSLAGTVTHDYEYPGYCVAELKVTNASGLSDTYYIPVFAVYPATYSSNISVPSENTKIYGNAVTLIAEVYPEDPGIQNVTFQYRPAGASAWINIGQGSPTGSYAISWNTTGLSNGLYELRAIVNGVDSALFKITTVEVSSSDPDITENVNGNQHQQESVVYADRDNNIVLPDGTRLDIPAGSIAADAEVSIVQIIDAGIGEMSLNITGVSNFLKDITITMSYPDANDDGIVDGTDIYETSLVIKWYNESTGQWEPAYNSVVHPDENYVTAQTNHLSGWGLFGIALGGAAAGGGASAAAGGKTASYCFIATAAYGSPMAKDVVTLREFRDRVLLKNELGRRFVNCYYQYSPPLAKFIEDKPLLRKAVRVMLKPLVKMAEKPGKDRAR